MTAATPMMMPSEVRRERRGVAAEVAEAEMDNFEEKGHEAGLDLSSDEQR